MILHTEVAELFRRNGAKLIADEYVFPERFKDLRALLFDWDGVFNEGWKGENVVSPFSEVDSMGINMLRFGIWLKSGFVPHVFIVTGLRNLTAQVIANRECFSALYLETLNKSVALQHIMDTYQVSPSETICFFDDILDVAMAKDCALRMFIHRKSNPMFENYLIENQLCDYVTSMESGKAAIREICEFLLGMNGVYDETIAKRIAFSDEYQEFLQMRKERVPSLYRFNGSSIEDFKL